MEKCRIINIKDFLGGYYMFIVNVEGAIRKENKWVIIERSKKEEHAGGLLSLVGGKVEAFNVPNVLEQNLQREITEETGIKVKNNMKYIHSISFSTDKGENVVNVIFLCEYESGNLEIKQKEEIEKIHLLTTEEILTYEHTPHYLKQYIQIATKSLNKGE